MKSLKYIILILLFIVAACKGGQSSEGSQSQISEAQQLKIFQNTESGVLKPTRWDVGTTTISNEDRFEHFMPFAKGLGGAHVGVGAYQNLTLAAWAKSEWVYLMDFTKIVVAVNRIHIEFLKHCKTPKEFMKLWVKNTKAANKLIKKVFAEDADYDFIKNAYKKAAYHHKRRIRTDLKQAKKWKYKFWLNHQPMYDHLRNLALKGHIRALGGDLSGKITLKAIAKSLREMQVTLNSVYFSNAEEYYAVCWPCNKNFMANFANMPYSDKSMIFRSVSSAPRHIFTWAPDSKLSTIYGFHYNVMKASLFKEWMTYHEQRFFMPDMIAGSKIDKKNGFSIAQKLPDLKNFSKRYKSKSEEKKKK